MSGSPKLIRIGRSHCEAQTLKSNFQGSIRGSKYELVRLKYRMEVVIEVAIFICKKSASLNCGYQATYISRPVIHHDEELIG